jgi:hypothetical protein
MYCWQSATNMEWPGLPGAPCSVQRPKIHSIHDDSHLTKPGPKAPVSTNTRVQASTNHSSNLINQTTQPTTPFTTGWLPVHTREAEGPAADPGSHTAIQIQLHCAVLHCAVLHCAVLHCAVLHCAVLPPDPVAAQEGRQLLQCGPKYSSTTCCLQCGPKCSSTTLMLPAAYLGPPAVGTGGPSPSCKAFSGFNRYLQRHMRKTSGIASMQACNLLAHSCEREQRHTKALLTQAADGRTLHS